MSRLNFLYAEQILVKAKHVFSQHIILSDWLNIIVGAPQGAIIYQPYFNDTSNNMCSQIRLFADDTSLFISDDTPIPQTST